MCDFQVNLWGCILPGLCAWNMRSQSFLQFPTEGFFLNHSFQGSWMKGHTCCPSPFTNMTEWLRVMWLQTWKQLLTKENLWNFLMNLLNSSYAAYCVKYNFIKFDQSQWIIPKAFKLELIMFVDDSNSDWLAVGSAVHETSTVWTTQRSRNWCWNHVFLSGFLCRTSVFLLTWSFWGPLKEMVNICWSFIQSPTTGWPTGWSADPLGKWLV